ncbi:MAG: family 43 glycosylhydrolase [Prolixibacteraceae bacterium]|jgi:hypothetical protein|nr:family 43 glycosylhydrolase [Prolixibacteraceae bacterium]
MKKNRVGKLILVSILLFFSCKTDKDIFIVNNADWLDIDGKLISAHDGGISQFDNTFYWYGSDYRNTIKGEYGKPAAKLNPGINVYTSKDLVNWKYKGIALAYPDSGWGSNGTSHRAHVLYNKLTKKYVMWFFHYATRYPDRMASVAVSDSPVGPFKILGFRETGAPEAYEKRSEDDERFGSPGCAQDLNVFKDDDENAYLVYDDGSRNIRVDLLTDDYLFSTKKTVIALGKRHEAPAMIKFKGKYLVAGSGVEGWSATETDYAVSSFPLGPYSKQMCMSENKTWNSQITSFLLIKKSGILLGMFDQWWVPDSANLNRSHYLWLPVSFDPETEIAKISYLKEWNPFTK